MMKKIGVVGIPGGWSTLRLLDALETRTGYRLCIDMAEVRLDLETGKAYYKGTDLTALDGLIVKKIAPSYTPDALDRMEILRFLHSGGLPVFSDPDSMYRLIDRLSGTAVLRRGGIPYAAHGNYRRHRGSGWHCVPFRPGRVQAALQLQGPGHDRY